MLLLALLLSGCGNPTSERIAVEGTVTLDGQPLQGGAINLVPVDGTKGPAVSAVIRQGQVHLTTEDGPFPGKYKAILRNDSADAIRITTATQEVSSPETGDMESLAPEPSSEITVQFTAGSINQTVFAF